MDYRASISYCMQDGNTYKSHTRGIEIVVINHTVNHKYVKDEEENLHDDIYTHM